MSVFLLWFTFLFICLPESLITPKNCERVLVKFLNGWTVQQKQVLWILEGVGVVGILLTPYPHCAVIFVICMFLCYFYLTYHKCLHVSVYPVLQ